MAIKAGQLVWLDGSLIIDRLQTSNANPNVPKTKIYELGNNLAVTTVRDTPHLSWDVESYDMTCEFEALALGLNPSSLTAGQQLDFNDGVPMNILLPFRSSLTNYTIVNGAIIPALSLASVDYKFGVKAEASQTFSFKGDSIFYIPGIPAEDIFTSDGSTATYSLSKTAIEYDNTTLGETQYVVNINVYNTDGSFYRLFNGSAFDYTDTSTSFTLNSGSIPPNGSIMHVQYGTATSESITQAQNNAEGVAVTPGALLGRNIDVFVGTSAATPTFARWTGVQSFDATWKVNLEANEELGNPLVVSQDYVVPDVSGTITTQDNTVADLFAKLAASANVSVDQVIGTLSSTAVPVEIHLNNPTNGARLKTIYIPDARFDPPQINIRVQGKLQTPFPFTSDTGQMYVYNGERPGGSTQP